MPREIAHYKTVLVPMRFNASMTTSSFIHCEFPPDEIILKYVSINDKDGANSGAMHMIHSDLIQGQHLFSLPGSADGATNYAYSEAVDIPFQNVQRPVNGNYTFRITLYDGTTPTNVATMNYYITLTFLFIKFKKVD